MTQLAILLHILDGTALLRRHVRLHHKFMAPDNNLEIFKFKRNELQVA